MEIPSVWKNFREISEGGPEDVKARTNPPSLPLSLPLSLPPSPGQALDNPTTQGSGLEVHRYPFTGGPNASVRLYVVDVGGEEGGLAARWRGRGEGGMEGGRGRRVQMRLGMVGREGGREGEDGSTAFGRRSKGGGQQRQGEGGLRGNEKEGGREGGREGGK
jgi:hypothetical protein